MMNDIKGNMRLNMRLADLFYSLLESKRKISFLRLENYLREYKIEFRYIVVLAVI